MGADTLKRTQVDVGDAGPDDVDSIRVYFDPTSQMPPAPSVSVIKALRVDPDKEATLEGWRNRYDGKSSWSRPWYKDQKAFKGYRGTLVHFTILSALEERAKAVGVEDIDASGDTYFHEVGDSGWGKEEYNAEYCLKKWSKKAPSANTAVEGIAPPRDNKYDGEHAWDKAVRGMKWAAKSFKESLLESGHIKPRNVCAIEQYVSETTHGYAGQFDLLYERDDNTTVLCDLKTSSGIRFDHKLQAAAYAYAVNETTDYTVDECEIVRLHPDSETVEITDSTEWDRTIDGLAHEFLGLVDKSKCVYDNPLKKARKELSNNDQ